MKQHRIAIVGSRQFQAMDLIHAFVATLPEGSTIVSGGAPGVDSAAEQAAVTRGLKTLIFPADWDGLGRKAGPIRNSQIVAHADRLVAFWDGDSHGTVNAVLQALARRLPVSVFGPDGRPVPIEQVIGAGRGRRA